MSADATPPDADPSDAAPRDPHRLHPDHLPTPFTAAEIRVACQPGRELRLRVEEAGEVPRIHVMRYVEADDEAALQESWDESLAGEPLGEPERSRQTWRELQEHASFPAADTLVTDDAIEILGGARDCLRYTQSRDGTLRTFWFARELPGPPIRWEVRAGERLMVSIGAVSNRPAGS